MARTKLAKLGSEERHCFVGIVDSFGLAKEYKGPPSKTVLLINIRMFGKKNILTDHLWLKMRKQLSELDLKIGDKVSFYARVDTYWKGYFGRDEEIVMMNPPRQDFTLKYPSKVKKLKK